MRRRSLLRLGLLAWVGLLALAGWSWVCAPTPGVTRESAARLRLGMTVAQAQALFGGPGEKYQDDNQRSAYRWRADSRLTIDALFDAHGRLWAAGISQPGDESPRWLCLDLP